MARIDLLIILSSLTTVVVFLILQILIVRSVDNNKAAGWSISIYKWGAIGNVVVSSLAYSAFMNTTPVHILIFIILSSIFYLSIALIVYLFIFGIAFTSVRAQLVSIIDSAGKNGLTYSEILRKYNKDIIVKKRLERLTKYGALSYKHGLYQTTDSLSLISIANYILVALKKVYFRNQR